MTIISGCEADVEYFHMLSPFRTDCSLLYSYTPSIYRHRPVQPDLSVFFLSSSQVLAW